MPINTDVGSKELFFKSARIEKILNEEPFIAIYVEDSFLEKEFLKRYQLRNQKNQIFFAGEMPSDWVENNLLSLDLFRPSLNALIYQADLMPQQIVSNWVELLNNQKDSEHRFILFFSKKNSIYKSFVDTGVATLTIAAPKFWEFDKLLENLLASRGISLDRQAFHYLSSQLENVVADHFAIVEQLNLEKSESLQSITLTQIQEWLPPRRVDLFGLGHLYGKKQFDLFYKKIMAVDLEQLELDELFRFMGTHLQRLALVFSERQNESDCLNKYEREIFQYKNLWTLGEILKHARFFTEALITQREDAMAMKHLFNLQFSANQAKGYEC